MGKYENLARHLMHLENNKIKYSFNEIEKIIGFPLPYSSYKHRPWWSNDKTHVQAIDGWLDYGWEVSYVDLGRKYVIFTKTKQIKRKRQPPKKLDDMNPADFEHLARQIMSEHFKEELAPRKLTHPPMLFDLVSKDESIVGDAKFFTKAKGTTPPPAKFATIAQYVWLLEKIPAKKKFIVFGKDKEVPTEWIKRYGDLVNDIDFYFIDVESNKLEKLDI